MMKKPQFCEAKLRIINEQFYLKKPDQQHKKMLLQFFNAILETKYVFSTFKTNIKSNILIPYFTFKYSKISIFTIYIFQIQITGSGSGCMK